MSAVSVLRDCGRASEAADDVDVGDRWSLLAVTVGGHSEAEADDDNDALAAAAYAPDDAVVLADNAAPAAPR